MTYDTLVPRNRALVVANGNPERSLEEVHDRVQATVMGGPRRYSLDQIAAKAGVSLALAEDLWRWLGIPCSDPNEVRFTIADLAAMREFAQFIAAEQLDTETLRSVVRSFGHSAERLVAWQVESFVEHVMQQLGVEDVVARRAVADNMPQMAPMLGRLLEHAYRRHLTAVIQQYATEFGGPQDHAEGSLPLRRAVGFADIVNFTRRTANMGQEELAEYVQEFETRARDIVVVRGGRVVKTVGDAVLFDADHLEAGAEVALALAWPDPTAREMPVRVGLVFGRVLSRYGDIFGPTVNLASRLSELAEPDSVLTDAGTAALLAENQRYRLADQDEVELQGFAAMRPVRLEWNPDAPAEPVDLPVDDESDLWEHDFPW